MYDRINELVRKKGLNISTLEKTLGLGNGIIGKWKKQSPSVDKLKLVADYLNVSIDYLLSGIEHTSSLQKDDALTEIEAKLLSDFRSLSQQGQDYIRQQMFIAREVYKKADLSEANLNVG